MNEPNSAAPAAPPPDVMDRRTSRRRRRIDDHRIVSASVRPGYRARLLDVSAGGAFIETTHRLLPGMPIELQFQTPTRLTSMRGRVLRSTVSRLRSSFISYRGAIRFERHLPWLLEDDGVVPSNHEHRSAGPVGVNATPQVM